MLDRFELCVRGRRAVGAAAFAAAGVLLSGSVAVAGSMPAAPMGKSYFFATRGACLASNAFTRQECVAAFANAYAEWRDRAPHFASGVDCRLRFALCELQRGASDYVPTALGVEIAPTPNGAFAAPVMAVETPRNLFPKQPIARDYAARGDWATRRAAQAGDGNLPTDRFEPFSKRPRIVASFSFNYASLGVMEGDASHSSVETLAERRARLRRAPFIE